MLEAPDGSTKPLPASVGEKATIGPLDQVGVWSIEEKVLSKDGGKGIPIVQVACNLANRVESDLMAPSVAAESKASLGSGFGGRPIWYYLIAMAWAAVGWEWFLYQRRWID